MKNLPITLLLSICLAFFACSEDEDDETNPSNNNNSNNNNNNTNQTVIENGMGKADISGDTTYSFTGTAIWEDRPDINSSGTAYARWRVELTDSAGNSISMQIVEDKSTSTMSGPDDGSYQLGGSMDENDVTLYAGSKTFLFDTGSNGSFTLSRGDSTSILLIDLQATDLEIGGIGSNDEHVNLKLDIKANYN